MKKVINFHERDCSPLWGDAEGRGVIPNKNQSFFGLPPHKRDKMYPH